MTDPRRLLLVDDEPDLLDILTDALEIAGFEVVTAINGAEAIARLHDGSRFDVVLSDVTMPGSVSGVDVATEAVATHPAACVIVASGHPRSEFPVLPARVRFMSKPYRVTQLLQAIDATGP